MQKNKLWCIIHVKWIQLKECDKKLNLEAESFGELQL